MHFFIPVYLLTMLFCVVQIVNTKEQLYNERNKTMNNQNQMKINYKEQEITYRNNAAGITLAGTLTLPYSQTKNPAVILVPGVWSP